MNSTRPRRQSQPMPGQFRTSRFATKKAGAAAPTARGSIQLEWFAARSPDRIGRPSRRSVRPRQERSARLQMAAINRSALPPASRKAISAGSSARVAHRARASRARARTRAKPVGGGSAAGTPGHALCIQEETRASASSIRLR